MLLEPLVVRFRETGDSLAVPAGLISDFASIPDVLQSVVSKLGPYNLAAIVHDYLYATQICSRHQADGIFFRMLRDVGTPRGTRRAMYIAVTNFGGRAWEENARLRAEGFVRVAPQQAREPWTYETRAQFQSYLQTLEYSGDSEPVVSPGFCTCTKPTKPGRRGRNHPSFSDRPPPRPVYALPHGKPHSAIPAPP
jgi:hypothetical protein